MKLETFFEKFDQFADAPDAVEKMRELVLLLAVQGKLVDQLPSDEPATKLLERIQKSKERLINERAIRRQETEPIDDDIASFSIPTSWVWTRLGEIGDWGSGSTPPRGNHDLYDGGITWLKSGELNDNQALAGSSETVTELALKTGSFRRNQPGDVLFAMYGATIGKAAILAEPAVTNQAVCGCTPFEGVSNRYLFNYLVSQRAAFHEASEGGAQPNLSKVKIVAFPFPLPPLAEQKRIVAKVDELMALCDRLEAPQQERETRHTALARASLARFALNPQPSTLNFLFHPSYAIPPADLRKSILTLAVQGHLSGTPSSAVEEQTALLDSATDPEFPISYGVLKPGPQVPNGVRLVKSQHVRDWKVSENIEYLISAELDAEFKRTKIKGGEVLLNLVGASIGRCAIAPASLKGANVSRAVAVITLRAEVDAKFFLILLTAAFTPQQIEALSSGTAQPVLNLGVIRKMKVWLPPLAEQRRIVAKVEQLMALVDALETQLAASRATAANLLSVLVAELTHQ